MILYVSDLYPNPSHPDMDLYRAFRPQAEELSPQGRRSHAVASVNTSHQYCVVLYRLCFIYILTFWRWWGKPKAALELHYK